MLYYRSGKPCAAASSSPSPVQEIARAFLKSAQNADGGWGYAPEQASIVEPTAAVMLAIKDEPAATDAYRRALDWLYQGQHADGGWGMGHGDRESNWHTAWAVWALAQAGVVDEAIQEGVRWLAEVAILQLADDEMQKEFARKNGIDPSVRGWPWLPGEAAWVEPTALTMLALQVAPAEPQAQARLAEGVRCLQDRRCVNGGWNVGSPVMLGASLPPRANPTAWGLLALAHVAPTAIQPEDAAVLRAEMDRDGGVLALAWGLEALGAVGAMGASEQAELVARLAGRQSADGSWSRDPYQTAVALMAVRSRLNV